MKHTAKFLTLALVLTLLVSLLTACGGSADSPMKAAAGTYKGDYTKYVGDDDSARVTDEPFSLDLNGDGTGVHHRDELDIDVTWTLEGETFTMKETFMGMEIDYTGTLAEGKLDIFNADPTDIWTCEYVYTKQ